METGGRETGGWKRRRETGGQDGKEIGRQEESGVSAENGCQMR
jgi:hypothetical protein